MSVATRQDRRAYAALVQDPVSLCGIGAVTGYGWGHKLLIEGLLSGESAVRPMSGFAPYFERRRGVGRAHRGQGQPLGRVEHLLPGRAARGPRGRPQRL